MGGLLRTAAGVGTRAYLYTWLWVAALHPAGRDEMNSLKDHNPGLFARKFFHAALIMPGFRISDLLIYLSAKGRQQGLMAQSKAPYQGILALQLFSWRHLNCFAI